MIEIQKVVRLFNPRIDVWNEHFTLKFNVISPKTEIGEATIKLLQFNHELRLIEREMLIIDGRYPPAMSSPEN